MDPYVLKIKRDGVLRRLTLPAGDKLVFSYAQLQSRTRDLFRLPATAATAFTYVDKDGDVVALADDQDLQDALVFQALNPLRITVTGGASEADSRIAKEEPKQSDKEDAGTPPQPQAQVVGNAEQDPGSASTIGTKQPDVFPIVEQSEITELATSEEQPGSVIVSEQSDCEIPSLIREQPELGAISEQCTSRDDEASHILPNSGSISDDRATEDAISNERVPSSPLLLDKTATEGIVNLNPNFSDVTPEDNVIGKTVGDDDSEGKGEEHGEEEVVSFLGDGVSENNNVHRGIQCDGCGVIPITGPRFKSCKKSNYDLCLVCFDRKDEAEQAEYVEINRRFYRLVHPTFDRKSLASAFSLKKSGDAIPREDDCSDKLKQVVHCGVQCDECGLTPIEGPRFKSCKRFNYDLCLSCYERSGSDDKEYHRLDGPIASGGYLPIMNKIIRLAVPYYKLTSLCERWVWVLNPWTVVVDQTTVKPLTETPTLRPESAKNVEAETETETVALEISSGGTPNSGGAAQVSQPDSLARENAGYSSENRDTEEATVYTFSEEELGGIEALNAPTVGDLPENHDPEAVAVFTFTEKELAGLEALNAPESNCDQEAHSAKASSLSATSDGSQETAQDPESANDMKANAFEEPTLDSSQGTVASAELDVVSAQTPGMMTGEGAAPTASDASYKYFVSGSWQSPESGMLNNDPCSSELKAPAGEEDRSSELKAPASEEDRSSELKAPAGEEDRSSELKALAGDEEGGEEDLASLDGLMAKLEGMGFTDQVLNKELLEKHNLDLRSTVDDLCAAEEWDPMLGDLQEMGFYDENMNRRLLIRNQGSLKPVVKELVRLAKGEGQA